MARGGHALGIRITVETDADIGTPEFAAAYLALDTRFPRWTPERFGDSEPLRKRLTSQTRQELMRLWQGREIRPDYSVGTILVARRSPVAFRGTIAWNRGQSGLNRIGLSAQVQTSLAALEEVPAFAGALFTTMGGQFGFAASEVEYYTKSVTGWWTHPTTGKPQGGSAVAPDRSRHLPGVYWVNLFGPAYVELFGESKLATAPAVRRERLSDSAWLICTARSPEEWNLEGTRRLQEDLMDHLGREAFFDPQNPDRPGVAPRFQRVRTIGGRLGGVSDYPVSAEFFSTPAEAKQFLVGVLDLIGRLRGRFRPDDQLDYSVSSLRAVDNYVTRHAQGKPARQDRETALEVAAYYGEVLRRNLGGRWRLDEADPLMPVVETASPPTVEYPLVRVKKLWEDRSSLAEWYDFVAKGGERLLTE